METWVRSVEGDMRPGTVVKMSEDFKQRSRGHCTPTQHVGGHSGWTPDPDLPDDGCSACSLQHVLEFGECIGDVLGPTHESPDNPEVDVMWRPSGLRYAYRPDDLEIIETYDAPRRAREKQASRDKDESDLVSGSTDRDRLRRENGLFSGMSVRVMDLRQVSR